MFYNSRYCQLISLKEFFRSRKVSRYVHRAVKLSTCSSLLQNEKDGPRYNPINIQMLSSGLHKQIFGKAPDSVTDSDILKDVMLHLSKHGLLGVVSFYVFTLIFYS